MQIPVIYIIYVVAPINDLSPAQITTYICNITNLKGKSPKKVINKLLGNHFENFLGLCRELSYQLAFS